MPNGDKAKELINKEPEKQTVGRYKGKPLRAGRTFKQRGSGLQMEETVYASFRVILRKGNDPKRSHAN